MSKLHFGLVKYWWKLQSSWDIVYVFHEHDFLLLYYICCSVPTLRCEIQLTSYPPYLIDNSSVIGTIKTTWCIIVENHLLWENVRYFCRSCDLHRVLSNQMPVESISKSCTMGHNFNLSWVLFCTIIPLLFICFHSLSMKYTRCKPHFTHQ